MLKNLLLLIVSLMPVLSWAIPQLDPKKSTVCSMTLNSDDEREIFRKQIEKDTKTYNPMVELTDFGGSDWYEKACSSGIKCDQLLISSHFSDTFSGTSNGVRRSLSLKKIEKAGCEHSCDGILNNPVEVYLMGCNTVATKAPDSRTPDAYLKHLIEDGIPQARAQLITENRYGKMGDDNKSRMARAFRGKDKILYGFTARGPSGTTVTPLLNDFFTKTTLGANLKKAQNTRLKREVAEVNEELKESLKVTAFDQCSAGKDSEKDRRICKLLHSKISVDDKLSILEDALTDDQWIKYVPTINGFFKEHPVATLTATQKTFVKGLGSNKVIGRQAKNLQAESKYQAVKDEWGFFIKNLGFDDGTETSAPPKKKDVIGDIIKSLPKD
jgi:hypothetical protein